MLGGGDLDGDTFDIYAKNGGRLLPTISTHAAVYDSVSARELPDGRTATVDDICNFVVEYINSDVLGLLADRHLTIADQSKEGTFDPNCMKLAELCSLAVDYAKHGNPIDIDGKLPKPLLRYKPDWHKAEIADPRDNDYYESDRALGHLYRGITLQDLDAPVEVPVFEDGPPMSDAISSTVLPFVQSALIAANNDDDDDDDDGGGGGAGEPPYEPSERLFARYARELRYIRATHTLTDMPGVRLAEEEVILGAILSTCTQVRWRNDRVYRMRLHTEALVNDTRRRLVDTTPDAPPAALRAGLACAWDAWVWAQENAGKEGVQSFGLLVLGVVLHCLKKLDALPEPWSDDEPEENSDDDD